MCCQPSPGPRNFADCSTRKRSRPKFSTSRSRDSQPHRALRIYGTESTSCPALCGNSAGSSWAKGRHKDRTRQSSTYRVSNQKPLIESDLLTVSQRLALLKDRVDELRDWIDYSALGASFAAEGLVTLHAGLVHQAHLTPDQLPSITRRTLLQSWVDTICNSEPTLRDFRSGDHQALISEFRTLDRKHAAAGFQRVVQAAEKHRPLDGPLVFGGERALLMREANKKKRHLPLRKLFAGMPNLRLG